ncbi:PP2C family protein-serine/threonine phosphatase [Streptomyces zaomyceticus]|uniref:PP2C family protein-serine/threonine phosphatase n=1 Tax=Streptomyces zaomyceticus TaxID=68286 RepID=UPI00386B2455
MVSPRSARWWPYSAVSARPLTTRPSRAGCCGASSGPSNGICGSGHGTSTRRAGSEPAHPAAEEFVTLLLAEVRSDGRLSVLDCGHPGPYHLSPAVSRLPVGDPLPPLGVMPLPTALAPYTEARLLPGETLVPYTDGAEEARDHRGRFFALDTAPAGMPGETPAALVRRVHTALLHHTGGPDHRRRRPARRTQRPCPGAGAARRTRAAPPPARPLLPLLSGGAGTGVARPATECRADQRGGRRGPGGRTV